MLPFDLEDELRPPPRSPRRQLVVDSEFQRRFVHEIVMAAAIGLLFVVGPVFYYLNQNYDLFIELAYAKAPSTIRHLEDERFILNSLLAVTFVAGLVFFYIFAVKLSLRLIGPLRVLKQNLDSLTAGKWNKGEIKVREGDDFHAVIESYNFFYRALRTMATRDLKRFRQLLKRDLSPIDLLSFDQWVRRRSQQLGLKVTSNENGESAAESHDSRRVS